MMSQRQTASAAVESGTTLLSGAAEWLSFAAAPAFAIMALLTAVLGGGAPHLLCGTDASPLGGMIPMYVLMSACHLPPWLRLAARKAASDARSGIRRIERGEPFLR